MRCSATLPREPADAKVSGFYEFTPAYTYGDPKHWSRAVNRLAVDARGGFGDGVKWKVGARVDVDPIYMGSNFYLQDVKENQRVTAIWRENYLDFDAGGWDFRVGAQNIVWGDVVGLFFADVVSARDLRDFLLPSFDVIRIPQWAARAEYSTGDSHVELVWVPIQTFDNIGKPGSDFYPVPLPSPTPENVAAVFQNPDRPSSSLSNSAYGFRANTLAGGWDIAGFYYRSYAGSPTFYRELTGIASQPFVYQPRYDRIWQAGGTFNKDFGSMVLHGEAVYASGQNYAHARSRRAPNGVVSPLDGRLDREPRRPVHGNRRPDQFPGLPAHLPRRRRRCGGTEVGEHRDQRVRLGEARRRLGAAAPVDPDLRRRREPGAAAAQLDGNQEHDVQPRRGHLHRGERRVLRAVQRAGSGVWGGAGGVLISQGRHRPASG